jgi:hypothetical protein
MMDHPSQLWLVEWPLEAPLPSLDQALVADYLGLLYLAERGHIASLSAHGSDNDTSDHCSWSRYSADTRTRDTS